MSLRQGPYYALRRASLNTTTTAGLAFALSAALAGCAAPIAGLALAAQGTTAAVALSLGSMDDLRERSAEDQCRVLADRGISVAESLESGSPANEGSAVMFEPAYWRAEVAAEGYPQVERARTPVEGTLAISDRSLTFVPPPGGAVSVRIPYELVRSVEVQSDAVAALVVASCQGRFDIVVFRRQGKPDAAMTADAAAALKSRVAAARSSR